MKKITILAASLMIAACTFGQKINQEKLNNARYLETTGRNQLLAGVVCQLAAGGAAYATATHYNAKFDKQTQDKKKVPIYVAAALLGLIGVSFEFNGIENIQNAKKLYFTGNGLALKL